MTTIPPRIEGLPIPETQTLQHVALGLLINWLCNMATGGIKSHADNAALVSSYGCINVEFDLEVLRIVQARLDDMIEELREELHESGLPNRPAGRAE